MQALYRVDRGGDPARGASNPPQPPRSRHRLAVPPDWDCASAAIAHRRGDHLARKRTQRDACRTVPPQPPGLCLRAERRTRTRRRRTRRSPEVGRRTSFFEHCPTESHQSRVGGTAGPGLGRSHIFRRSAQGWSAGGMTETARSFAVADETLCCRTQKVTPWPSRDRSPGNVGPVAAPIQTGGKP